MLYGEKNNLKLVLYNDPTGNILNGWYVVNKNTPFFWNYSTHVIAVIGEK